MELYFYNYILKINKLFIDRTFKKNFSAKPTPEDYTQLLIYKNIENTEDKFIINIISYNNIKITIPIKKTNYLYTSYFINIEDVYNYLKYHINIYLNNNI